MAAKKKPRTKPARPDHLIVTRRVRGSASIAEFAGALRENVEANYSELADAVLGGSIQTFEQYKQAIGALTAMREMGVIIRETLLQEDEEEAEDEAERQQQRRGR